MSKAEYFVTKVDSHGLPGNEELLPISEEANVLNLSKELFNKIYWTLEAIEVSYQYRVGSGIYQRAFSMDASKLPKERIFSAGALSYRSVRSDSECVAYLNLSNIGYDEKTNTYAYELELEESDQWPTYYLTLYPHSEYYEVDRFVFEIFGCKLTAYLSVEEPSMSGRIDSFEMKANYYQF